MIYLSDVTRLCPDVRALEEALAKHIGQHKDFQKNSVADAVEVFKNSFDIIDKVEFVKAHSQYSENLEDGHQVVSFRLEDLWCTALHAVIKLSSIGELRYKLEFLKRTNWISEDFSKKEDGDYKIRAFVSFSIQINGGDKAHRGKLEQSTPLYLNAGNIANSLEGISSAVRIEDVRKAIQSKLEDYNDSIKDYIVTRDSIRESIDRAKDDINKDTRELSEVIYDDLISRFERGMSVSEYKKILEDSDYQTYFRSDSSEYGKDFIARQRDNYYTNGRLYNLFGDSRVETIHVSPPKRKNSKHLDMSKQFRYGDKTPQWGWLLEREYFYRDVKQLADHWAVKQTWEELGVWKVSYEFDRATRKLVECN
jgi:hypothetical protein